MKKQLIFCVRAQQQKSNNSICYCRSKAFLLCMLGKLEAPEGPEQHTLLHQHATHACACAHHLSIMSLSFCEIDDCGLKHTHSLLRWFQHKQTGAMKEVTPPTPTYFRSCASVLPFPILERPASVNNAPLAYSEQQGDQMTEHSTDVHLYFSLFKSISSSVVPPPRPLPRSPPAILCCFSYAEC